MAKLRAQIPNFLTLVNLVCGCLACTGSLSTNPVVSSYYIFAAGLFDFLDGTAARLLKAQSELGKQLDSFSDLISFGLAPALLVHRLLLSDGLTTNPSYRLFFLLLPVCTAIRLSRFNLSGKADYFFGLPCPASALIIATIPLVDLQGARLLGHRLIEPNCVLILTVLLSLLMISNLRMLSLKFSGIKWSGNQRKFLFLASIPLAACFGPLAVPLVILFYFLLSLSLYFSQ